MKHASGFVILLVLAGGCARPTGRGLADDDASFKIPAIKSAVAAKDDKAIPQLVEDLESDDSAVRFYAIEGLRRLTGETFDYLFYDDEADRRGPVEKWKEWLSEQ